MTVQKIAAQWKTLSEDERKEYHEKAAAEKQKLEDAKPAAKKAKTTAKKDKDDTAS